MTTTAGTLETYLRWRGDLTFTERPFTIVDNLVLAALSYLDLDGVVPTTAQGGGVTIAEAADRLDGLPAPADPAAARRLTVAPRTLLRDLARSRRFRDAVLTDFIDVVDPDTGTQFAALTAHLEDGTAYVTYRGTDNTIVGWREDFMMSFTLIPAQVSAATYLRSRLATQDKPFRVGGHSKGGNLAVYAAMTAADVSDASILAVYNNDGPGLSPQALDADRWARIADRVTTVVPEFAVIGELFAPGPPTHVVASGASGLLQHDLMTWQVEVDRLVERPALSGRASAVNGVLSGWLDRATPEERTSFTDDLFGALGAGGAELVTDVGRTSFGSFESVLFSLVRPRGTTRSAFWLWARTLGRSVAAVDYRELVLRRDAVRAALTAILGIAVTMAAVSAVQFLGSGVLLTVIVVAVVRLTRYFLRFRRRNRITLPGVLTVAVLQIGVFVALTRVDMLLVPSNLLLGLVLLANGWMNASRALRLHRRSARRRGTVVLLATSGAVSGLLGMVALSTAGQVLPFFLQQAGQYLTVAGLLELFLLVNDHTRDQWSRARLATLARVEVADR